MRCYVLIRHISISSRTDYPLTFELFNIFARYYVRMTILSSQKLDFNLYSRHGLTFVTVFSPRSSQGGQNIFQLTEAVYFYDVLERQIKVRNVRITSTSKQKQG